MTTAGSSTGAATFRPELEWVTETRAKLAAAITMLPHSGLDVLGTAGALWAAGLPVDIPKQLDLRAVHRDLEGEVEGLLRAVENACSVLDECCDAGADPDTEGTRKVWHALVLRSRVELQREALRHWGAPHREATLMEALSAADDLLEHRLWLLGCVGARASAELARIEPGRRKAWWWLAAAERHARVGLGAMAELAEWVVAFPEAKDAWTRALADASRVRALTPTLGRLLSAATASGSEASSGHAVSIRDWLRARAPTGTMGNVLRAAAAGVTQTWVVLFQENDIVVSHVDGQWLWLHIGAGTQVDGRPTLHVPGSPPEAFEPVDDDPGSYRLTLSDAVLDAARVVIRVAHSTELTEITLPSPPAP